ncbi:dephospho-CoA kinase [Nakamurella leprariae]|uniref:Dephospho-CoA kinase n=1 Tax=Nakamurella leprariae TaxID=2803911 RepID=A0A939BYM9_9ACTN|nr:dephospho-CoA kinase [Nakamurella leprariae]MBM9466796.1 dephospho-CoA kinase [Nakamurella leprariae]
MITAAVTGGIGSGKSTVSRRLAELGAVVSDSDQLARQVVAPGTPGLAAVAERFGAGVLTADGALDRAALAAIVFGDPAARRDLEAITHPLVRRAFRAVRDGAAPGAVVVNDIPILTALAVAASFHLVIGVTVDDDRRVARLIDRGMTEADARARIAAQIGDAQRRPLCDVWLDNNGVLDALVRQVDRVWSERLVPFAAAVGDDAAAPRSPAPVATDLSPDDRARVQARLALAVGTDVVDDERGRFRAEIPAGRTDEAIAALHRAGWLPVPSVPSLQPHDGPGDPVLRSADPGAPTEIVLRG